MRVLQIGSDRSKRGILYPGTAALERQRAYAHRVGHVDIIGFSLKRERAVPHTEPHLAVYPTNSTSKMSYLFDALAIARRLPKPDAISVQDPFEIGFAGWLLARMFGVPLHVQIHTDFLSPEFTRHSLINYARILIADFVVPKAAGIRVVSARIRDGLERRYLPKARISVLPIFVDLEKIRNAVPDPAASHACARFDRRFLFVGRLEREKHPGLALRAFAAAAPSGSCLIVVGDGSERPHLEHMARELGVADRVFFEGLKDAASYYALADLMLVTSHYEGYGLAIVEALAAGKPVLSTDVGIAREAGAIIAAEEDFADALEKWCAHGPRSGDLKIEVCTRLETYAALLANDITELA